MRTPEQIENLRRVLVSFIGPFALMMPPDMVDKWADRLQSQANTLDEDSYNWKLQVRTDSEKSLAWDEIDPEPQTPYTTYEKLSAACGRLFLKHPGIVEICLTNKDQPETPPIIIKR